MSYSRLCTGLNVRERSRHPESRTLVLGRRLVVFDLHSQVANKTFSRAGYDLLPGVLKGVFMVFVFVNVLGIELA